MGSHGIKDKVAIVGMGCTRFTEHWDKGADQLAVEATNDALHVRRIDKTWRSTPIGWAPRSPVRAA